MTFFSGLVEFNNFYRFDHLVHLLNNTTHALSVTTSFSLCDCKLWIETYLKHHDPHFSDLWRYKHRNHLCFQGPYCIFRIIVFLYDEIAISASVSH